MIGTDELSLWSVIRLAKKYYDEKTFNHAIRVMIYVSQMNIINKEQRNLCMHLAIMHDLLEDSEFSKYEGLPTLYQDGLELLTKPRKMTYVEYCKRLKELSGTEAGYCAYMVKLADMKDHLSLKETLTTKLKEKYLEGLAHLL